MYSNKKERQGKQLDFDSVVNFRELGGYKSGDGRRVKYGMFYRSGIDKKYNNCDGFEKDLAKLHSLGVKVILDFRSKQEVDRMPDPKIPGVDYYNICALLEDDGSEMVFSPEDISEIMSKKEGMVDGIKGMLYKMYRNMPFGNIAFKKLFEEIKEKNIPILFHCSAGKDRTGVAAMLILLALGVDEEEILDDYELTNM